MKFLEELGVKWISVKEKLPDNGKLVLVTDGTNVSIGNTFGCDIHKKNAYPLWDCFGTINTMKITHWMPLPERPEEEKSPTE